PSLPLLSNHSATTVISTLSLHDALPILWVSTFHSACLRVLRTYGERIDLKPGFAIYDDGDQLDLLKEVLSGLPGARDANPRAFQDRKSTRLNSSHVKISYAVFCLKKIT